MEQWAYVVLSLCMFGFAGMQAHVYLAQRKKARQLEELTYYDGLTKARNMNKFVLDAGNLLRRDAASAYSLIYMDIESFKLFNEQFGYAVGDRLLIAFSEVFSDQIESNELFARVMGDSFVALVCSSDDMELIVRMDAFYSNYRIACKEFIGGMRLEVVAGIYICKKEDVDILQCIDRANTARKSVKGVHQSEIIFYDDVMHERLIKEKNIENVMERALRDHEFLLYLQPKYDLNTHQVSGAEALIRWRRPDGTIVPPGEFIPLFEKNEFIIEIDFYIFESVCKLLRKWMDEGRTLLPIAVNVSRIHVNERSFFGRMERIAEEYHIEPQMVELEITESVFLENEALCVDFIRNIKEAGFSLAMDDFGTGYSSLNLLREIAFDVLKIDKSFLSAADETGRDKILISNIVRMAKELGMKIVAEGVETKHQADFLAEIQCDLAQGFLFSKPLNVADFERVAFGEADKSPTKADTA